MGQARISYDFQVIDCTIYDSTSLIRASVNAWFDENNATQMERKRELRTRNENVCVCLRMQQIYGHSHTRSSVRQQQQQAIPSDTYVTMLKRV